MQVERIIHVAFSLHRRVRVADEGVQSFARDRGIERDELEGAVTDRAVDLHRIAVGAEDVRPFP